MEYHLIVNGLYCGLYAQFANSVLTPVTVETTAGSEIQAKLPDLDFQGPQLVRVVERWYYES